MKLFHGALRENALQIREGKLEQIQFTDRVLWKWKVTISKLFLSPGRYLERHWTNVPFENSKGGLNLKQIHVLISESGQALTLVVRRQRSHDVVLTYPVLISLSYVCLKIVRTFYLHFVILDIWNLFFLCSKIMLFTLV